MGLARGPEGRVRVLDPNGALVDRPDRVFWLLWHRQLLQIALHGSVVGYRWHACVSCEQLQLLHAVKENDGRACRMMPGCAGAMRPVPLPVPKPVHAKKARITPIPAGMWRLPLGQRVSTKSHSRRPKPREALDGDVVSLLYCPIHSGRRVLVKAGLAGSWRCPISLESDDDDPPECGLAGEVVARYTLPDLPTKHTEENLYEP